MNSGKQFGVHSAADSEKRPPAEQEKSAGTPPPTRSRNYSRGNSPAKTPRRKEKPQSQKKLKKSSLVESRHGSTFDYLSLPRNLPAQTFFPRIPQTSADFFESTNCSNFTNQEGKRLACPRRERKNRTGISGILRDWILSREALRRRNGSPTPRRGGIAQRRVLTLRERTKTKRAVSARLRACGREKFPADLADFRRFF